MKTQHTPGPWKLIKGTHYQTIRVDNHVIADMRIIGGYYPYNNADAPLIAAAPELLEALENALEIIKGEYPSEQWPDYGVPQMEAAIQKARGEQ